MAGEMNYEKAADVGQDKGTKDYTDKYDAEHGKYKNNVDTVPTDDRLATSQMPKAPDPNPFTLGPMTSGGR